MRVSVAIDWALLVLKWPVAAAALFLLPGIVVAFAKLLGVLIVEPGPIAPFVGGFALYLVLWHLAFKRPGWGSLASTFEHELTHALFAWATGHRVIGLRATWREGGEIRYRGRGNWLITIAPYFFPTASVVVALVLGFASEAWRPWIAGLLGASVSYHATSTWLETHRRQPDLRRVGLPFAVAFLPAANLLALGTLLAFTHAGTDAIARFLGHAGATTRDWFELIRLLAEE